MGERKNGKLEFLYNHANAERRINQARENDRSQISDADEPAAGDDGERSRHVKTPLGMAVGCPEAPPMTIRRGAF
ncbi:hypothetical protein [Paenibacillus glycinis]|uniref:Uncharacterized protein n=1 Tax=Paenibacillus glycinis TaxID=2697035 RepID=A0ABW9XW37_9BACL|nr:hypothetical protein [Paenibacillus glycinis]NBD26815.1 hypothetical protein [Paenibacillus glycinis]